MFTLPHFIWLAVCALFIALSLFLLLKYKVKFDKVVDILFVIAVVCEVIKILTQVKMLPNEDGFYYPYVRMDLLPFNLCTIQIALIAYLKFTKDKVKHTTLLGFMFPSCFLGALLAILMPTIFSEGIHPYKHIISYEFFLYHACLVIFGLYIPLCKQVEITHKNYFKTIAVILVLGFISLYFNAMFSIVDFEKMEYISITNFLFTYDNPLGIKMTELWHWYLYLVIIFSAVFILIGLTYVPYFIKYFKDKKQLINTKE